MEKAFGDVGLRNIFRLVIRIRVQRLIGDGMVLEQGLEVLLSVAAKEEAVDAGSKSLEGPIRGRKEGRSGVSGGIVECLQETRLEQTELKGAELSGQECDDLGRVGRGDEETVDAVNDSVGAKLERVSSIARGVAR